MTRNPADLLLNEHLDYLKLTSVKENCQPLAVESAANHWSHLDYLGRLLQGEVAARQQRTIARRIKAARFPGRVEGVLLYRGWTSGLFSKRLDRCRSSRSVRDSLRRASGEPIRRPGALGQIDRRSQGKHCKGN